MIFAENRVERDKKAFRARDSVRRDPGEPSLSILRCRTLVSLCVAGILIFSLGGCPERPTGPAEDQAAVTRPDEQAPPRVEVPYDGHLRLVSLMAESEGATTSLDASEVIEIPDGASLYLETWQRLEDHRVRLVDGNDRLIPFKLETGPVALRAHSFGEPEPGGTWIRIRPEVPLVDGRVYQLKIEPELADRVTDHEGRPYEDFILDLRRLDTSEPEGLEDAAEAMD